MTKATKRAKALTRRAERENVLRNEVGDGLQGSATLLQVLDEHRMPCRGRLRERIDRAMDRLELAHSALSAILDELARRDGGEF